MRYPDTTLPPFLNKLKGSQPAYHYKDEQSKLNPWFVDITATSVPGLQKGELKIWVLTQDGRLLTGLKNADIYCKGNINAKELMRINTSIRFGHPTLLNYSPNLNADEISKDNVLYSGWITDAGEYLQVMLSSGRYAHITLNANDNSDMHLYLAALLQSAYGFKPVVFIGYPDANNALSAVKYQLFYSLRDYDENDYDIVDVNAFSYLEHIRKKLKQCFNWYAFDFNNVSFEEQTLKLEELQIYKDKLLQLEKLKIYCFYDEDTNMFYNKFTKFLVTSCEILHDFIKNNTLHSIIFLALKLIKLFKINVRNQILSPMPEVLYYSAALSINKKMADYHQRLKYLACNLSEDIAYNKITTKVKMFEDVILSLQNTLDPTRNRSLQQHNDQKEQSTTLSNFNIYQASHSSNKKSKTNMSAHDDTRDQRSPPPQDIGSYISA